VFRTPGHGKRESQYGQGFRRVGQVEVAVKNLLTATLKFFIISFLCC
jgi:hypothetical protein